MKNNQDQPSAMGMMSFAYEYIECSIIVDQSAEYGNLTDRASRFPAYFLACHGIELIYKAYLIYMNIPYSHLYNKIGHDLTKCLLMSKEQGLDMNYSANDLSALELLTELNKENQFRYIKTGQKQIPYWSVVEPLAVRLHQAVAKKVGARTFDIFYPAIKSEVTE
jgi:hypothetical protein